MRNIDYTKIIKIGDENEKMVVIELPRRKLRKHGKIGSETIWYVKIKCECGHIQDVPCCDWKNKRYKQCRVCQRVGSKNYAWNGYGEINGHYFCHIKCGAKSRGLKYNVSKKYLWELYVKQERKCRLSGLPINFTINKSERTASLDRIDTSKGYKEGNVQWIHKTINVMKNGFREEDFLRFCKIIYEYNRDRIQGPIENISNRRNV